MKAKISAILITVLAVFGITLYTTASQTAHARSSQPSDSPVITSTVAPRNVILFIGDGMGPEQIRAAGMYQNGSAGTLVMESFPYFSTMTTYSANSDVTDSAAGATAMATGHKVNNGVLSIDRPGDNHKLETLLERFHTHCKRAGLATTTFVTHATPAAFGAHELLRTFYNNIAYDYLLKTRPDVLFGGGGYGLNPTNATAAGYTVVTDREAMLQTLAFTSTTRVSGQFGTTDLPYEYDYVAGIDPGYITLPHLSEMVSTTLRLLEDAPNGFFLMVEGGRIDHAGHANDIARNVFEVLEFDSAIEVAYTWAISRTDTLIIVTADHETGGLEVVANNGAGNFPTVTWATTSHTATPVPVYAWGANAELAPQVTDNTHIYHLASAGLTDTATCAPVGVRLANFRSHSRPIEQMIIIGMIAGVGLHAIRETQTRHIPC